MRAAATIRPALKHAMADEVGDGAAFEMRHHDKNQTPISASRVQPRRGAQQKRPGRTPAFLIPVKKDQPFFGGVEGHDLIRVS
jgi:hypothetical protein